MNQPNGAPAAGELDPERRRLAEADRSDSGGGAWRRWGPYLSERAWGSVREDYSTDGEAWDYFPFDQARSRAYRWNEDGMAGICDAEQNLCFGLTLWNGVDPFLKERAFGLSNHQGNHGEDVKDYWWYLDSTPTHSYMRWRYHYPQAEFPYQALIDENARRGLQDPEYELLDTGIFDNNRYFVVEVTYAKAGPDDICIEITARNLAAETATLHLLPALWGRNTWSWGDAAARPELRAVAGAIVAESAALGRLVLIGDANPELLFCDNETNRRRCFGDTNQTGYPKDGINDHVVEGADTVNPAMSGTKAAFWHRLEIAAGATARIRLRLSDSAEADLGDEFSAVLARRHTEAEQFYAPLTPADADPDEAMIMRQAFAGMLWSKQFYHYDIERWLQGDPGQPPPPPNRGAIRNGDWQNFGAMDVIAMPDTWEYPWFASWDLGFHCVALAHVDAEFAKRQLVLLCREWYMHPNGQLPAYEWNFSDVNPPVHAWAALRVFEIDGSTDLDFLERIFHKLLINFTWWVNRKDAEGNNVFEGGFLGLDNIGAFNRSCLPPGLGHLEQSDGTAWMAMYCLNLLEMALVLAHHDDTYEDVATKFFEHFAYIASAMDVQGLWNEEDGFYYDVLHLDGARDLPIKAHSIVGLIALCGVTVLEHETAANLPEFTRRMLWFLKHKPSFDRTIAHIHDQGEASRRLFSIVDPDRLRRILSRVLDEGELLSPYGLRALSAWHREHPLLIDVNGISAQLDYEPGESTTAIFGGNSNWRGPIWFPVNYLIIEALRRFDSFLGVEFTVELPTGSGQNLPLDAVAADMAQRLVGLFRRDGSGVRPVFGGSTRLNGDPEWRDLIPFHEYFHGDTGAGLGASHQTGWTGLVADLIARRARPTLVPTEAVIERGGSS